MHLAPSKRFCTGDYEAGGPKRVQVNCLQKDKLLIVGPEEGQAVFCDPDSDPQLPQAREHGFS